MSDPAAVSVTPVGCGYRHVIILLGFLANVVSYTDRSSLSLAIIPMSRELPWLTPTAQGQALAAFFCGYILTQVLGGVLSRQYGPTRVIFVAVFLWSVATFLTPWAAATSLGTLFAARVAPECVQ